MRAWQRAWLVGIAFGIGATQADAASKSFCSSYAKLEQKQFQTMQKWKKCQVPRSPRWDPVQRPHYEWCLTASVAAVNAETRIRSDHLVACGAQVEMSEPGMNPVN